MFKVYFLNFIFWMAITGVYNHGCATNFMKCPVMTHKDFCILSSGKAHKNMTTLPSQRKFLRKLCGTPQTLKVKGFGSGSVYYCTYPNPSGSTLVKKDTLTIMTRAQQKMAPACPILYKKDIKRLLEGHIKKQSYLKWRLHKGRHKQNIHTYFKTHPLNSLERYAHKLCTYHLNGLPVIFVHTSSK